MTKPDLRWLAGRVSEHPDFMGWVLREYQKAHRYNDVEMARILGCTPAALVRLALCGRPGREGGDYMERVRRIALHVGCNQDQLARVLQDVEEDEQDLQSVGRPSAYIGAGAVVAGLAMAARGRD